MPEFKTEFATEIEPDPALAPQQTADDLRKAQEEEWGQYVAATRIYSASGALAFLPGHAVPASSVSDAGPVLPSQVVPRTRAVEADLSQRQAVSAATGATAGVVATDVDARPAGNATAEEWRAYAVSQGMAEADAANLNRDDLRAQYAG